MAKVDRDLNIKDGVLDPNITSEKNWGRATPQERAAYFAVAGDANTLTTLGRRHFHLSPLGFFRALVAASRVSDCRERSGVLHEFTEKRILLARQSLTKHS